MLARKNRETAGLAGPIRRIGLGRSHPDWAVKIRLAFKFSLAKTLQMMLCYYLVKMALQSKD